MIKRLGSVQFKVSLVYSVCLPSKHARFDSEAFWLHLVMAGTASMQPEWGHITYARSNFPHLIQLCSSKEGPDHIVKNQTISNLDGLVRVWPNASGPEASWCARIIWPGSGRMEPAHYQFPTFSLCCVLPQMTQTILCKTSPDLFWFWLTVSGFGQTDLVQKQGGMQKSSGLLQANTSKPIQIGCESDPVCLLG